MLAVAAVNFVLLCSNHRNASYKSVQVWVLLTAILAAIHEFSFYVLFSDSSSFSQKLTAISVTNISALWLMPPIVTLLTRVAGHLYSAFALRLLMLFCLIFTIIDILSPVPFPFATMPSIELVTTFWGEQVPFLVGPESALGPIRSLMFIVCHLWCISAMFLYVRSHKDMRSKFFIFYMVFSSLLFVHDSLVLFHVFSSIFISLSSILMLIFYFSIRMMFEHHSMQSELSEIAFTDSVTGLANRANMTDYLATQMKSLKHKDCFSFCVVDINHFSVYNHTFGYRVGNIILKDIAQRLTRFESKLSGKLCRLDGDRFLYVCVDEDSEAEIERVGKKFWKTVNSEIFIGDRDIRPNCTVGVATLYRENIDTTDDIFGIAEQAIQFANETAKSTVVRLENVNMHANQCELSLLASLENALANFQMTPYFQPQVTACGQLIGAEVLVRWNGDHLGQVSPDQFIPIAEKYGLIHKVGAQVMENSLIHVKPYESELIARNIRIAANVSSWELGRPSYVRDTLKLFRKHNVSPTLYTLEITESAIMHNIDDSRMKLLELKQHGFRVAMDDFGTGYSSLSHLTALPIDVLKIDKSFIDLLSMQDNEAEKQRNLRFINGIVEMAGACKSKPLAEGVENEKQLAYLSGIGVQLFQGYYFSLPLPFSEFEDNYLGLPGYQQQPVNAE